MNDSNEFFGIDLGASKDYSAVVFWRHDIDSASALVTHLEQAKLHSPDFFQLNTYYVQYPGGLWRVK